MQVGDKVYFLPYGNPDECNGSIYEIKQVSHSDTLDCDMYELESIKDSHTFQAYEDEVFPVNEKKKL